MDGTILNSREKKRLFAMMADQWGMDTNFLKEHVVVQTGSGKIFFLTKDTAELIGEMNIKVYSFGNYFGTIVKDEFRASIEGSQFLGKHAMKNVIDLTPDQAKAWISGEDIQMDADASGYCLIRYKDDFLGCGKYTGNTLLNYVPKSRRIKNINAINI
ncbi:MAG: methyltransferase RsmF C-terminal domain-like protein [Nanoarchaeota archaeon]